MPERSRKRRMSPSIRICTSTKLGILRTLETCFGTPSFCKRSCTILIASSLCIVSSPRSDAVGDVGDNLVGGVAVPSLGNQRAGLAFLTHGALEPLVV